MASNRSLFCLALLAICFVASGSAAVVDSGSNGSCQLVLQHTPLALPVACPRLPPCPCARFHAQLTPVPACSLSKMLRGGGGCLPCKHWTNAPSVVTWFRCVPVKLDFLKQIARAKQARCANDSCPAPLIPHCCPCMRFSGNKAKHAPPASVSLVPTSSPLSGFSLIFSLISPAIIHA